MANLLQSSQCVAQQAPSYYTSYLSNLACKGTQAQANTQFVGAQPLQQKAFNQACQTAGAQQPTYQTAQGYVGQAAGQNITGAASPYLSAGTSTNPLCAMQPYANSAMATSGLNVASPMINRGTNLSGMCAANPYLVSAASTGGLCAAKCYIQQGATQNITGAANPLIQQAAARGGLCAAQPYLTRGACANILGAASPYLQQAANNNPAQMAQCYMNPYIKTAVQCLSDIANRNIQQNLDPQAVAASVGSGQFGSQRGAQVLGQINAQAEKCLNSQISQMLASGYGQALCAAGKQQALLGQLGNTAGALTGQQAQNALSAGQTAGTLGQQQQNLLGQLAGTSGCLASKQAQTSLQAGQTAGTLSQQQQNLLGSLGQTAGTLTNQQAQNLITGGNNLGALQSTYNQTAAGLGGTASTAQQAYNAAQLQAGQTAANAVAQQASALNQAGATAGTIGTQAATQNLACINALANLGAQCQTIKQNAQNFPLQSLSNLSGLLQGYTFPTSTKTTMCMSPLSGVAAVGSMAKGLMCSPGITSGLSKLFSSAGATSPSANGAAIDSNCISKNICTTNPYQNTNDVPSTLSPYNDPGMTNFYGARGGLVYNMGCKSSSHLGGLPRKG